MRISKLVFVLAFIHYSGYCQVNPSLVKPIPQVTPPLKNLPVKTIAGNPVFYIESNGFWAADFRNSKVVSSACPSAIGEFQWQMVTNNDGTITWLSQTNTPFRLVYRKSNLQLPRGTGLSGTPAGSGFGLEPVSGSSSGTTAAFSMNDKWFMHRVNADDFFWMVSADHQDSSYIHLYRKADINNVDFAFSSLTGWEAIAGSSAVNAFAGQPSAIYLIPFYDSPVIPAMPLGGSYWRQLEDMYFSVNTKADQSFINTARPGNNKWIRPDEAKTGTLTSLSFVPCGEKMTVRIAGTQDAANIKFELLQRLTAGEAGAASYPDGYYRVISTTTGHGNDITRQVVINTSGQKYKVCRFRITDNSTAGHIVVDDINLSFTGQIGSDPAPPNPVIPAVKPVWGAIDMHTHPMSYLGMGGKLMYGRLDGNPAIELGNCNAMHGGWGTDNGGGNFLRAEIINMVDEHYEPQAKRLKLEDFKIPHMDHPHDGFPALVNWPVQNSMTHQQMWFDWIKRAKEGGLKAIIALTVNSEVLGRVLGGDPPYDDFTVANRQIDSLNAFVYRHRDFMDTVTSAARMRQVINSGRMAVIIGMEVDNLGNFYENVNVTEEQVRNEIIRLKNKGVRYVFPIHVTDNKFGGTAVYKTLFNLSNKYVTGQPLTGSTPVNLYPPVLPGHLFRVETAPDPNITFRLKGSDMNLATKMRPLVEIVEAGGIPPDPLLLPFKPIVDPAIIILKNSQQYQLAKKIFLDRNPEFATYDGIKNSSGNQGGHRNVLGLSPLGIFAINEMMRQGLMIDVDHASEKSVNEMINIAQRHNYPLNSGHNGMRGTDDNEKTRTTEQMNAIRNLGGMFGTGWENQSPVVFNNNYRRVLGAMGGKNTTFGSDINGYAATPLKPVSPSQNINYTDNTKPDYLQQYHMAGSSRVWNYNTEGMGHFGMVPDFFEALKKAGASTEQLNQLFLSAEYFARMWEKCETQSRLIR